MSFAHLHHWTRRVLWWARSQRGQNITSWNDKKRRHWNSLVSGFTYCALPRGFLWHYTFFLYTAATAGSHPCRVSLSSLHLVNKMRGTENSKHASGENLENPDQGFPTVALGSVIITSTMSQSVWRGPVGEALERGRLQLRLTSSHHTEQFHLQSVSHQLTDSFTPAVLTQKFPFTPQWPREPLHCTYTIHPLELRLLWHNNADAASMMCVGVVGRWLYWPTSKTTIETSSWDANEKGKENN